MKMYEVELKYRLLDEPELRARLSARGACAAECVAQCDLYFNHPQRNFAQTDEALRIRTVAAKNFVTYKGPRVDQRTKTRLEIEIGVADGAEAFASLRELYERLGFTPVREVRKQRRTFSMLWENRRVVLAIDHVEGLGAFVEIETMADESDRVAATDTIIAVADSLGLKHPEQRSYLSLLEDHR